MRSLESILRNVIRPLPSVADARRVWVSYRRDNGYKGDASLLGAPSTNTKLSKGAQLIYGLTLLPWTASGYNACPNATDGCAEACVLMTAGRGVMSNVRFAREVKTRFAAEHPAEFLSILYWELSKIAKRGDSIVRLNVASDVRWEYVLPEAFDLPMDYYDYTKWPTDKRSPLSNYRIVYSRNERDGDAPAVDYVRNGGTAAVVFRDMPESWYGLPVVNGDDHDDRTVEPAGTIIGLSAKGAAKHDTTGFVV